MHACSARTQPLAGNRRATLQAPEAPNSVTTQPLAGNRRVTPLARLRPWMLLVLKKGLILKKKNCPFPEVHTHSNAVSEKLDMQNLTDGRTSLALRPR